MATDVRAAAARALAQVIGGASLNQVLPPALETVADRDRALLQQLCYGTLREAPKFQAVLGNMLAKPLRDRDRDIQGLLLCGLYQLDGMRIPDHAAVSATVAATKALRKTWARGMTNALLRRYQRERDKLLAALPAAQANNHPDWLYQQLHQQWPSQAQGVIEANNTPPPMTLRTNAAHTTREEYLQLLELAGIQARPGRLSPQAITLAEPYDVGALPGFAEGRVSVQDEAAQMAAHLLQARPGERVLDACAAPGGKACHILEMQPELKELVAMDVDEKRLVKVRQNLQRLGLEAGLHCDDASRPGDYFSPESFDHILVDAPCSATGVIRRHPDVKLLRRADDIPSLGKQQLQILQGLWPLLRRGGRLLYATCSVLEQENDDVVASFLQSCEDAQVRPIKHTWGEATAHGRQLLPTPSGPDGLYYCVLSRAT